jgi:hypothetical protein
MVCKWQLYFVYALRYFSKMAVLWIKQIFPLNYSLPFTPTNVQSPKIPGTTCNLVRPVQVLVRLVAFENPQLARAGKDHPAVLDYRHGRPANPQLVRKKRK